MDTIQNGKEVLTEKLRAMQFAETAKPSDRMDADLVDVLTDMLLDLDGESPIGQAEHDAGIRSILDRISTPSTQANHKRTWRKLLIAAIIAALIFAAGLVYITLGSQGNPVLHNWTNYIIERVLPGASIETQNKITIYNDGKSEKYNTVDEYLNHEKLNILYPSVLPDGYELVGIQVFNDSISNEERIIFVTNKSKLLSISVELNKKLPDEILNNCSSVALINGHKCYLASDNNWYQAVFFFKGNLYMIDATSYDELETTINNMKGSNNEKNN